MDDIKNGQRINCNGVHGTIIGKRSTRNQRFVLVKMDNGFTLKLKADTLSGEVSETGASAQLNGPILQVASFDPSTNTVTAGPITNAPLNWGLAPDTVTPIPATLPLFATGLGGLGLLGWRRRRKAQAV